METLPALQAIALKAIGTILSFLCAAIVYTGKKLIEEIGNNSKEITQLTSAVRSIQEDLKALELINERIQGLEVDVAVLRNRKNSKKGDNGTRNHS